MGSGVPNLGPMGPLVTEGEVSLLYDIHESIGQGSFGEALLATRKEDGLQVVIKRVRIAELSEKEREDALKEVKLLSQFNHSNIIRYFECIVEDGALNIVMEYAEEGELSTVILDRSEKKRPYSEDQIMFMFVQLLLALKHVHSHNVLHRDLKSQNVFLSKGGVLKLGDFGIARVLNSSASMARTAIGTPYYLSPEILEDQPYNSKSDVWALGCILYELTTLKRAFDGDSLPALIMKILRGRLPPIPTKYSSPLRDLISSMLKQQPQDRPSVQQILRKDYVKKYVSRYARYMIERSESGEAEEEPELDLPELPRLNIKPGSAKGGKQQSAGARLPAFQSVPSGDGTKDAPPLAPGSPFSDGNSEGSAKQTAGGRPRRKSSSRQSHPSRQSADEDAPSRALADEAASLSSGRHSSAEPDTLPEPRGSKSTGGSPLKRNAEESLNQAAIAISAQVGDPAAAAPMIAGVGPPKHKGRPAGFPRQQLTQATRRASDAPSASGQVKMDMHLKPADLEKQQRVEAERERRRQVRMEKDRREREEAARRRQERQSERELRAQEEARKAQDLKERQEKQRELELFLKEKETRRARERQESARRIAEHRESLKYARPTLNRASRRKLGAEFAERQALCSRVDSDSVLVLPPSNAASEARWEPMRFPGMPGSDRNGSPDTNQLVCNGRPLTPSKPATSARRRLSGVGDGRPHKPAPGRGRAAQPLPQRRLWARNDRIELPSIQIYAPNIRVWSDIVEDDEAEGNQQQTDEIADKEEVHDGLKELRSFNDRVKQIWDARRGRDLLQVLGEIQDVLEGSGETDAQDGCHLPPIRKEAPARDGSPTKGNASAARVERLRLELAQQMGEDKLMQVYRHLRSLQDDEQGQAAAGSPPEEVLRPEEMHLVRQVSKLMLMEDKVFS